MKRIADGLGGDRGRAWCSTGCRIKPCASTARTRTTVTRVERRDATDLAGMTASGDRCSPISTHLQIRQGRWERPDQLRRLRIRVSARTRDPGVRRRACVGSRVRRRLGGSRQVTGQRLRVPVPRDRPRGVRRQRQRLQRRRRRRLHTVNDPGNCGACGNVCAFANGIGSCVWTNCALAGSEPGYRDLDPARTGCEYRCPVFPPLPNELCNGLDDNCDGQVDEPADLEAAPTELCVTRANTPAPTPRRRARHRNGVSTWYCQYGAGVEFDPRCRTASPGREPVRRAWTATATARPTRTSAASAMAATTASRALAATPASSNASPATRRRRAATSGCCPTRCRARPSRDLQQRRRRLRRHHRQRHRAGHGDGHLHLRHASRRLQIRHQSLRGLAPRRDRLVERHRQHRTCSKPNVLPWTRITFAAAQAACAAAGLRLCTGPEFTAACAGTSSNTYPYGMTYQGTISNGADFVPGGTTTHALVSTGDARLNQSVRTTTGIHDLSAMRRKEWTSEQQGSTTVAPIQPIYVVRGGASRRRRPASPAARRSRAPAPTPRSKTSVSAAARPSLSTPSGEMILKGLRPRDRRLRNPAIEVRCCTSLELSALSSSTRPGKVNATSNRCTVRKLPVLGVVRQAGTAVDTEDHVA